MRIPFLRRTLWALLATAVCHSANAGDLVVTDGHGRIAAGFTVKVQPVPGAPDQSTPGNGPARPAQTGEKTPGGERKS